MEGKVKESVLKLNDPDGLINSGLKVAGFILSDRDTHVLLAIVDLCKNRPETTLREVMEAKEDAESVYDYMTEKEHLKKEKDDEEE